jgi:Flp pilus assembly protein CpaB
MRTPMTKRTKTAMLAGAVLLAVGAGGAVYLGSRDKAPAPTTPRVQAYFATAQVDVGTAASTALAEGRIRARAVAPAERPANGVSDPTQLSGRVAAQAIAPGTLVTTEMFPAPQTRIGTVVIPAGKRALALELAPVAGVAGYAGAGDKIDVYGVATGDTSPAGVRLVLQGVEILKVNGAGLAATPGQPGSANLVYLLAVTPVEAERLIYLNEFEKLYFDLMPKDEAPVKTPGAGPAGALAAV